MDPLLAEHSLAEKRLAKAQRVLAAIAAHARNAYAREQLQADFVEGLGEMAPRSAAEDADEAPSAPLCPTGLALCHCGACCWAAGLGTVAPSWGVCARAGRPEWLQLQGHQCA